MARFGIQSTPTKWRWRADGQHMKRSAHDYLLGKLGLSPEQSIYLSDYGHLGQVDQFLSLTLAKQAGKLKPGDLVVLVAAGVGYVWNALCLRWGGST